MLLCFALKMDGRGPGGSRGRTAGGSAIEGRLLLCTIVDYATASEYNARPRQQRGERARRAKGAEESRRGEGNGTAEGRGRVQRKWSLGAPVQARLSSSLFVKSWPSCFNAKVAPPVIRAPGHETDGQEPALRRVCQRPSGRGTRAPSAAARCGV